MQLVLFQTSGYKPEPELAILTESCDPRPCDQRLTPMCSPHMHLMPSPVPQVVRSSIVQEKGEYLLVKTRNIALLTQILFKYFIDII